MPATPEPGASPVGTKSPDQPVPSGASVRQKNSDVPSGALTSARSASCGPGPAGEQRRAQPLRAAGRRRRVGRLDGQRADAHGVGRATGVDQDPSAARLEPLHRLRAVHAGAGEAERAQRGRHGAVGCPAQLDERVPAQPGSRLAERV